MNLDSKQHQGNQQMEKTKESNTSRGPTAPFWETRGGKHCHPTADAMDPVLPSKAMAGCTEESGRSARIRRQEGNGIEWVLGKQASGKKERMRR